MSDLINGAMFSYYIRYEKLFELCNKSLKDIDVDTINVYIDIEDMIKPLYANLKSYNNFELSSRVINLIAHIRGYLYSAHRLYARVFLVYGENNYYNNIPYIEKNMTSYITINRYIKNELEFVKLLTPYIYDAYYVNKKCNFSTFVYDNITTKQTDHNPNVVITKNKYAYQLPALCDDTHIFRPKKYNGDDISYSISYTNVYDILFKHIKLESTKNKLQTLSPKLIGLFMALIGLPKNGLVGVMNTTTVVNELYNAINNHLLLNDYNGDIEYIYKTIPVIGEYLSYNDFCNRYYYTDLIKQHILYTNTPEYADNSYLINITDPETVKSIAFKYYKYPYSLDLNYL